jgi:uncharacterized protein YdeI (YjbR/CyaY-like superfamily)
MTETTRKSGRTSPESPQPAQTTNVEDEVRKQIDRFFEMRDSFRKLTGPRRRELLSRLLS